MATKKPNNVTVDESTKQITFNFNSNSILIKPVIINIDDLINPSILNNTYKDDNLTTSSTLKDNNTIKELVDKNTTTNITNIITIFANNHYELFVNKIQDDRCYH